MSCGKPEIYLDYKRLFELLTYRKNDSTIRDFLETFLVLHGAREGALLRIKGENIVELNTLCEKHGLVFLRYVFPESTPYEDGSSIVLVQRRKNPFEMEKLSSELARLTTKKEAHVKIGERIGYMTPLNISVKNRSVKTFSASINVDVEYYGDVFTIQLVPQLVQNKIYKEIEEYYKPIIACIPLISRLTPILIKNIELSVRHIASGGAKIYSKTKEMNPIVSLDTQQTIPKYIVKKILSDEKTEASLRKFFEEKDFPLIIDKDADVFNEEGKLLLRFRKKVLSQTNIEKAYEALQDVIKGKSKDRGVASGSKPGLDTGEKKEVMSNIIGYFDKWTIGQKGTFKRSNIKKPGECRFTSFNVNHPEKFQQVIPLIKEIDQQYKELCPEEYADQRKAARSTPFHIKGTSFSTITTNLNFRTAAHRDAGDWPTGFGNLVVIERGSPYKGSYTGFPQYGVAVDCRHGDFLAMDVHQLHANTAFEPEDETSQRISLVSYLREGVVKNCGNQKMYDAQKLEKKFKNWRLTQKKST